MDYYQMWFNLCEGADDLEFCANVDRYLGALTEQGLIEGFRITRRKLGLGPPTLGEFHISIEVRDLAQLEGAFLRVSRRDPEIERLHAAVYGAVTDIQFALYRDFPDPHRIRPGE